MPVFPILKIFDRFARLTTSFDICNVIGATYINIPSIDLSSGYRTYGIGSVLSIITQST
ncbi:uncharacterized protein METZ01_LOCUS91252, partial [marine metagenome]